jgi:CubicO group peptidase (beta-lactamase class C family)
MQFVKYTGDDLPSASLSDAGVRGAPITNLMEAISSGKYQNVYSILILRGGRIIVEEYFQGYSCDKPHQIRSATKSIGSILVGIAIDKGYIPSVEQPIYYYFRNNFADSDARAKDVTIKSLLTMTSGFDCDDHSGESFQCERAMYKTDNWVSFALNLPMAHQPGEHWAYNSTSLILLSEIIHQASGLSVQKFADEFLMGPLGINDFKWGFSPKGHVWLGGNASIRPRDMAKLGQTCLENGTWKDQQIVSKSWLEEATRLHACSEYGMGYGYLWWRGQQSINGRPIEAFWAQGNGGQVIFICPKLDMVAVFTGGNYNSMLELQFMGMLINYIIPAMLPPTPGKIFIHPGKHAIDALTGSYRCNDLPIDLLVEGGGMACQLAGLKSRFLFETKNQFYIPNPIFGDMNGKIIKDNQGKVIRLQIQGAFSDLVFKPSN